MVHKVATVCLQKLMKGYVQGDVMNCNLSYSIEREKFEKYPTIL